jgi:FAD/FMN-containing dehydrogenase
MARPLVSDIASAASRLRAELGTLVLLPGEAGYDRACVPWNLAVEQHPAAVAVPSSAADVARVVRAAATAGLKVVPQSTGHGAAPLAGRLDGAVLLRMSGFSGVWIDAARRRARVIGATAWQEVAEAASVHGLAAMHGSGPDIAVAGYTLGGGLSWYARKFGLACNHVVAAEIVVADGSLLRVDADNEPELFWALRGGGGNFGVVTALEFGLQPLKEVYAGVLLWDDPARTGDVCRAWADWTHGLPEEATTSLRLLGRPLSSDARNVFPGRQVVVIDGAVLGDFEDAAALLARLRALHPAVDTFTPTPAAELTRLHFDPELPSPVVSSHLLLGDFDAAAADVLVAVAGADSDTTLLSAEIRHLGGALRLPAPGGGALDTVDGSYSAFFLAGGATATLRTEGAADTLRAADSLAPWSNGRHFLNFTGHAVDAAAAFGPAALARLLAVRDRFDPARLFVANHDLG